MSEPNKRKRSRTGKPKGPVQNASSNSEIPKTLPKPRVQLPSSHSSTLQSHLSGTTFQSFRTAGLLSPRITIPFEQCTDVQAATLPVILQGNDVLAQAKTGTGKTIAFALPIVQRFAAANTNNSGILALILSPTRELAAQIADATQQLLTNLPISVQITVGGNNPVSELKRLTTHPCHILVATPGRLQDHLSQPAFKQRIAGLSFLVLDEADRLLDAGFKQDLTAILQQLPDRTRVPRQCMLFSATLPADVAQMAKLVLKPGHTFVSTLAPDEVNTHERVPQVLVMSELPTLFHTMVAVLTSEIQSTPNSKIMLFLPTARSTQFAASLLAALPKAQLQNLPIWPIHSRLSQSARNKSADAFKNAAKGILVSSDVTARGMDFPSVTLVLQTGLPQDAQQYIHRLGRTARAGADGKGILILCPFERFFLAKKEISVLPIQPATVDWHAFVRAEDVQRAMLQIPNMEKAQAWSAWLGYYKSFLKSMNWTAPQLVENSYRFVRETCLYNSGRPGPLPPITAKTIGKMGLKAHRNLFNVVAELPDR